MGVQTKADERTPVDEGQAEFFKLMMDQVHSPVHVICPSRGYRVTYANAATCRHLGFSENELLGMSIPEWDPNFPLSECDALWEKLKRDKRLTFETLHKLSSGEVIPVEVTCSYFGSHYGEFIVGFIQDISDRIRIQKENRDLAANLASSNESLKQFSYIASHDLQEPLRMVSSFVQLLEKQYSDRLDQCALDYIHFAVDGVVRMKGLIDALLEYSRVEHSFLNLTSVNVQKLVDEITKDLSIAICETSPEIVIGELPSVRASEVHLCQVLQNLISNALKFKGDAPPKVTITHALSRGEHIFCVKDEGIGIDENFHHRIFEIFQRLHTREEYPGSGLGLSICKKIIESHGGRMWVESSLGKGATFFFSLPNN